MVDKTGFTAGFIASSCGSMPLVKTSSIKDQTKIGVTYKTMNNEFYKVFIRN